MSVEVILFRCGYIYWLALLVCTLYWWHETSVWWCRQNAWCCECLCCFRLASNYLSFLSMLGIKNPVHKQKLSIKATDVVLFGPPKG